MKLGPIEERREYFRINFASPLHYQSYSISKNPRLANNNTPGEIVRTHDISESGVMFKTELEPPQISSVLWMNMDIRTLRICKEIEQKALVCNNGILGRVVRVEEDLSNDCYYDVGVCFLTREDQETPEIKEIMADITKSMLAAK